MTSNLLQSNVRLPAIGGLGSAVAQFASVRTTSMPSPAIASRWAGQAEGGWFGSRNCALMPYAGTAACAVAAVANAIPTAASVLSPRARRNAPANSPTSAPKLARSSAATYPTRCLDACRTAYEASPSHAPAPTAGVDDAPSGQRGSGDVLGLCSRTWAIAAA